MTLRAFGMVVAISLFACAAPVVRADLCEKCADKMYVMSVGKCAACGGPTSSGSHKLCAGCSAKLVECEHCRAKLAQQKKSAAKNASKRGSDKKKPALSVPEINRVTDDFWTAVKNADTAKMGEYYADEVTVLPNSELLKRGWGLNTQDDETLPLAARKADLLKAYDTMMGRLGRETWIKRFGGTWERLVSLETARKDNFRFEGVKADDTIMKVTTSVGGDPLFYVWRETGKNTFSIVMECADY